MEIQGSGLRFSLDANIAAALDLMKLAARRRPPLEPPESLVSLVLGRQASREAVFEFRRHLLDLLTRLEDVDEVAQRLPDLRASWARAPHVRRGPLVWVPNPSLPPSGLVNPAGQPALVERILGTPERFSLEIQRGRLTLGSSGQEIRTDDQVDLTRAGLACLQEPQLPVAVLRLPPRYPTLGGVLQVVRARQAR